MRKATPEITGFVLAGGQSSRMGQDKGLLPLHGKPLVEHVLDTLKNCVAEGVIIANTPAYNQFGYPVLPDLVSKAGPMGGIYTALTHAKTDLSFIVSCDMPFITEEAVQFMLHQTNEAAITVPTVAGRLQPLFGLYHQRCLLAVENHLQQGKLRLQEFVRQQDHRLVQMDTFLEDNPFLFLNLNTPQDYEEALKRTTPWTSK